MLDFEPLFRNPHLQTIASHYWPRPESERRWPIERRLWATEPGVRVRVDSQDPQAGAAAEFVLVHGLEGDGRAVYIRGLAFRALEAGFAVHRFHMRTCGGTEGLCQTLYHAGLTGDLRAVVEKLGAPAVLVGFSMGANVVLKLAGELGEEGRERIRAVVAVSAPLDLAVCARRISERENRLYEMRFVRRMRARLMATGRYGAQDLSGLDRLIAIDDRITAPSFGFTGAEEYYRTQSALRFLGAIRVPTLLIQARDDHFIPFSLFDAPEVRANPRIELVAPRYGGHVGFLARRAPTLWLDRVIVDWVRAVVRAPDRESRTGHLPY